MGNLGPFLPTILVVLLVGGLAYHVLRRRRMKDPPDGHDR